MKHVNSSEKKPFYTFLCIHIYLLLTTPGKQHSTSGLGPWLYWLQWFPGDPVEESEELSGLEGILELTCVSLAVITWKWKYIIVANTKENTSKKKKKEKHSS